MTLGERVKLARTKRGLTQDELAERSGLSNGYISLVERDGDREKRGPGVGSVNQLATALGVPVEWLAYGVGDEPDLGAEVAAQ